MVRQNSQISLYRKIDHKTVESMGINIKPVLKYRDDAEDKIIYIKEDIIALNEHDENWSPNNHELSLGVTLSVEKPYLLFGKNSITAASNKIGLACHMYSKESHFQKTVPIDYIRNVRNKIEIDFKYEFPPSSLRGHIYFEFFIYLAEKNEVAKYQADRVGMILNEENVYELELIVDGDASVFPMTEFEEKDGPLWKLEKYWVDANDAIFDSSNVNLSLNTQHPLFDQVQKGKTRVSRAMMGDIMIQAMTQIIQQVILIENNSLDENDIYPNSIMAAVKYWIDTFDIKDVSSIFSISNSLRTHWERKLMEGESDNN